MYYNFQSIEFSIYSKYNLKISNKKKIILQIIIDKLNLVDKKIRGIRRVISISKIKKINLIRKNWILKGRWLGEIGSNPHSKGDIFSRFVKDFLEIKIFKNISKIEIIQIINKIVSIIIIIYIKLFLNILIGS